MSTIKAVQTCRRQVPGLDDDAVWRDFLDRHTGLRSTRAMTPGQLSLVVDALRKAGARSASGKTNIRVPKQDGQARKLLALWIALGRTGTLRDKSDRGLCAWAGGELGLPQLDSLAFLDTGDKRVLIDRLKAWCRREGADIHGY